MIELDSAFVRGASRVPSIMLDLCALCTCATCAIRRAVGAGRASSAGGRVSRKEQVVGSIPTGGPSS